MQNGRKVTQGLYNVAVSSKYAGLVYTSHTYAELVFTMPYDQDIAFRD